ncbi:hypothetical protein PTKIN_Ptkin06aG0219500 [Pterospermum kingtungense]
MAEPYPNLWRRSREEEYDITDYYILDNSFKSSFYQLDFNTFVDTHTKEAALRVSPSLVSLISYSGEKRIFWASGIVIECDNVNGTFFSTILTSASLLRLGASENSLPEKFKVEVILPDGSLCPGDIIAYDWHFNISAIKIQSSAPLPTADLRCLDDTIQTIDTSGHFPLEETSLRLLPRSNLFKLFPGDDFIALGRYHSEPYELMVAPGKFSINSCRLDCKELLRCGIGGPMINLYGEVVGINFYAEDFTPFLPMNVVSKWWEHVKGCREYDRPWLGMQVIRLFTAEMDELEKIVRKFPNISIGIVVEEVTPESPAAFAGIYPNDVIVQFDGKDVQSCLELFEVIWDKVGKRVDLVVLRASNGARLDLSMVVGGINTGQFNR